LPVETDSDQRLKLKNELNSYEKRKYFSHLETKKTGGCFYRNDRLFFVLLHIKMINNELNYMIFLIFRFSLSAINKRKKMSFDCGCLNAL